MVAGSVGGGEVEGGGDAGLLGAGPQQARIGPVAEREAEGIQPDRLTGAGLAGEDAEAATEGKVELLDDDDVANRQADQTSQLLCRKQKREHGNAPCRKKAVQ